jgi:hypothetical protein
VRSIVENQIRMTYAVPPALAAQDEQRRRTYTASILMFEQLLAAARSVDYLTRPLPLFYALSQAGRAVVAAYGAPQHPRGHGLAANSIREPITHMTVKPRGTGLFQAVAAHLASPDGLRGPVELGALWSALPDLADSSHGDSSWTPALFVWPEDENPTAMQKVAQYQGTVVVPDAVRGDLGQNLGERLRSYPHARFIEPMKLQGSAGLTLRVTPRGPGVPCNFVQRGGDGQATKWYSPRSVPEHRYTNEHWLIPRVGESEDFLPPLLLWWVLLFGLSLLARYEPATWRASLDVEQPLAVPLEDLLDEALVAVPHWVLWALQTNQQLRLPRPQAS